MPVLEADSVYVYIAGGFDGGYDYFENISVNAAVTAEGGGTELASINPDIYYDYDNANGRLFNSASKPAAGNYDVTYEIDFNGDGSLTDDSGDAETTETYAIPDTSLPVVFVIDLVDIPLLMSDRRLHEHLFSGISLKL